MYVECNEQTVAVALRKNTMNLFRILRNIYTIAVMWCLLLCFRLVIHTSLLLDLSNSSDIEETLTQPSECVSSKETNATNAAVASSQSSGLGVLASAYGSSDDESESEGKLTALQVYASNSGWFVGLLFSTNLFRTHNVNLLHTLRVLC